MTRFFIGVASNQDAQSNISEALMQLSKVVHIAAISTFHETPAIDRPSDPSYTNGVIALDTSLHATVVRRKLLKSIEQALGRTPAREALGSRSIDLDLILEWSERPRGHSPRPHADVLKRFFVARALYEILGDVRLAAPVGRLGDHLAALPATPMRPMQSFTLRLRSMFLPPTVQPTTNPASGLSPVPEPKRLANSIKGWMHTAAQRRLSS